jgi:hypothetical protein
MRGNVRKSREFQRCFEWWPQRDSVVRLVCSRSALRASQSPVDPGLEQILLRRSMRARRRKRSGELATHNFHRLAHLRRSALALAEPPFGPPSHSLVTFLSRFLWSIAAAGSGFCSATSRRGPAHCRPSVLLRSPHNHAPSHEFSLPALRTQQDSRRTRGLKSACFTGASSAKTGLALAFFAGRGLAIRGHGPSLAHAGRGDVEPGTARGGR